MKKLLNTLFVTTQGAYLCHEGESVLVKVEQETKLRVPIHTIGGIVCFGQVLCSPPLLGLCGERNVLVTFLTENGRFQARVEGPVSGNVLLRREQYRRSDDPKKTAEIARAVITGKIANERAVLRRAVRDHGEKIEAQRIEQAVARLTHILEDIKEVEALESLRGMEGDAAKTYFEVFDQLITVQKSDFFFKERSRRPPMDNINALLSFVYTMLVHDTRSALESVGLDPQVGFLHRDRPGRPSLALDIIEEFRPCIADRVVLSLVNLQQVQGKGFKKTETGAVEMTDDTRKEVIMAYQKRKQEEIQHPFLGESVQIGLLFHCQALLLARFLRGDLDGYPPFVWK